MGSQAVGDTLGFVLVFILYKRFKSHISDIIKEKYSSDEF